MKNTLILCMTLAFCSCEKECTDVEFALRKSGANRSELERVLTHYSRYPADTLKLKAAEFLIANMPGHYSYYGPSLESYRECVDSARALKGIPWSIRNIYYLYPYQNVYALKNVKRIEDVECMKASYLIDNIERAFDCWQYPWARHLNFDDFCEYLLPYRIGNEPLCNWRDSLQGVYDSVLKRMNHIDELFESPYQACLQLNDRLIAEMKQARKDSVCFTHPMIGIKRVVDMKCPEYIPTAVLVMRALGIPVSLEMIEQWSGRRGRHYWNAVYHFNGLSYPFTGFDSRPRGLNQDYKMNKVYRRSYTMNKKALISQNPGEPIPEFLENRFLKDVTKEYMICHDITVDLQQPPVEERKYAYLCVFNNETWTPVHYGKINHHKVAFTDVGPQTMFVAGYYIDDKIQPASLPFHVDLDGGVKYVSASASETTALNISRKYPLLHRFANYSRNLVGTVIESSDFSDFRQADVLDTIRHDACTQYDSVYVPKRNFPRRYYRIRNASHSLQLSELETYTCDSTKPRYGRLFLPEGDLLAGSSLYDLYNKDITDYIEAREWIGIDFFRPVTLKKIKYLPRTDSNHIMAGDVYELFVFKNNTFNSLGEQRAASPILTFEQVPVNGLYLLKNKSRGREHRIFTYREGQIYFW